MRSALPGEGIRAEIPFLLLFEHLLRRLTFPPMGGRLGKPANRSLTLTFTSKKSGAANHYECKTRPDGLFLRNKANARPRSPVPSSSRDEGSGVATMSDVSTAGPPFTSA